MKNNLALFIGFIVMSCQQEAKNVAEKPIKAEKLFHSFYSYQTQEEFKKQIQSNATSDVKCQNQIFHDFEHGDLNMTTCQTDVFEHLKLKGRVEGVFIDNQLWLVKFFPQDENRYIESLREEGIIDLTTQNMWKMDNLTIVRAFNEKGEAYVGWWDKRISKEITNWFPIE